MSIPEGQFKDIILAVARKHKFRPGLVEKDYYLTVILNTIDPCFNDQLVFKGGTLLNKIHLNYHRLMGNFTHNFGLAQDKVELLHRQVETDLMPVIRADEQFDLGEEPH